VTTIPITHLFYHILKPPSVPYIKMSENQFKNAVENLVEDYIPSALKEKGGALFHVPYDKGWFLLFEDPSGVLDLFGCGDPPGGTFLHMSDPKFISFLKGFEGRRSSDVGDWRSTV
jgi:hypothetical protein